MKAAGIALTIIIALALQTSLARFLTPGAGLVDLVFVAVVYIALSSGPTAGLDCRARWPDWRRMRWRPRARSTIAVGVGRGRRARSIIGIGGLAKTVVGFFAGIVGSQFIVARPLPRALVFFTATVAHAIIFVGLYRVHRPGYTPGVDRRDLQPGRRQRARRRAGVPDQPISCRASSIAGGRWAAGCGSTGGLD